MGKAVKTAPEANADVDAEISKWFDIIDTKCLADHILSTCNVQMFEHEIVLRAAELAGVSA